MAGNTFGTLFRITTAGESHGPGNVVIIDGVPPGLALSADEKTSVHNPTEMARLADALPIDRIASRWVVSTDPDEHVERIAPYIQLGFNHLVFHAPGADQARFLSLYAKDVLPRLRKKFG